MSQIKIPDKIHVLTENGEQLLHRLYSSRQLLQNPKSRPLFLNDEKIGRAIKNLMSKFPDFPELDKVQGVDLLTSRAKQYVEDLEQHYETLVDVCDWKEAAFSLLQEIAGNTVALRFTSSIQLSSSFIELVVIYGKIHILVSMINDRRVILGLYARLIQHLRSQIEPNYSRVVKWINDCDVPVKKLQDEFRVLNDSIGHVLMSIEPTYAKRKLITQLRRDGALNLILKPEDIARPVQDQYRIDLTYASRMNQWILYGYLFAPGSLTTPNSIELVKSALSEGFNLPVFKDISFPIHGEFSSLFKSYKSKTIHLQKQKKVIKEAAQASTQEAPRKHNEKRIYVRQELEAMWNLFRDRPCLLAPKFNVLLAALSMAKEEIFWYFRHIDSPLPEKVKKYYNKQNDVRERRISSLFYLIDHLVALVKTHKRIIQSYYIEYIAGADTLGLNKVLNPQVLQNAGPTVSQTIGVIMQELQGVSLDAFNRGTEYNFSGLRDNWCRLEYLLYSSSCPLREAESSQISSRLNLIYIHSRNIDQIEQQLDEFSSLCGLWSFKDPFVASFDATLIEGNDQPTHVMNYLKLLSQFPSGVATPFFPEEKETIGKECVEIATGFLNKISSRIVNILTTAVVTQYQSSEAQLADVNAAFPLLQKRKDWKPPKDFVTPVEPGTESSFRARAGLEQLRLQEKNAFQLCTALNEFMDIVIYDHQFIPREYLRERLGASLKQFMRQISAPTIPTDPSSMIRATAFESQVKVFLGVMVLVENYIDIDVGGLIRETLLAEFYAKALGKCGRIEWFPEGEIEYSEVTLHNFTNYFTDFISKKAQTPGVVYSPGKFGFLSRVGLNIRAEEHTDYAEIQSFVNMVGPYGVKLVERELLRYVLQNTNSLKEMLVANMALLEQYSGCFYKSNGMEQLKRFKVQDLDNFVSRSVGIGNALHLRQMLRQAVKDTNTTNIPYIQKAIETAFMEYNRNTFSFPEFLGVDTLALDAGLDVGTADQYLKVFLKKLSQTDSDVKIWDMLPVMYAVCFSSTFWKDAVYRTTIEGHSNNVHVLALTINSLLIAFGSINYCSSASEVDIVALLQRFLEISSVQLLRLFRTANQKYLPGEPASVIIFLDKFVEECPLLTKDNLEQYLPYTFIRNMYKDIYENKPTEGSTADQF